MLFRNFIGSSVFGGYKDMTTPFASMILTATEQTFGFIQHDISQHVAVIKDYYDLVTSAIEHCPFTILSLPVLQIIELIIALLTLKVTEKACMRAALSFLEKLVSYKDGYILSVLHNCGQQLVAAIFIAIGSRIPRSSVNLLADVLFVLATSFSDTMRIWVTNALTINFPEYVTNEDKSKVLNLIFCLKSNQRKFKSMINDFAQICCQEMTSDVLLSYEFI